MSLVTILPLAFVMIAGPQIVSAIFLATSHDWRRNSASFLAGAFLSVLFFTTVSYVVTSTIKSSASESSQGDIETAIDAGILVLMIVLGVYVFLTRKNTKVPSWMGKLENADPRLSFRLGVLLLGIFPTDIITSVSAGAHVARSDDPWLSCLPFVLVTVLLLALPVILLFVLGQRAETLLPQVREWMTTNSWLVNEIVIAFFAAMMISSLAG